MRTRNKVQLALVVIQVICLGLSLYHVGMPYTQMYSIFGCLPVILVGML